MGIDYSKYQAIENQDELIKVLEQDGLIILEAPDPITGEPLFTLTPLGREVFPGDEEEKEVVSRLSNEVYQLWQHGMVEVAFDEDDFSEDMVSLTPDAYDPEKVLVLPRDVQVYLATIKRSFEKAFDKE